MTLVIPVILCGGSGTRLWPLSRESMPKQCLRLLGEETLLQMTATRAMAVSKAPAGCVVVITQADLQSKVTSQLSEIDPELTCHVIGEPAPRQTGAAIATAALYISKVFGDDALMWVLPSDHFIKDEAALRVSYEQARAAAENNYLVTFGITPTRPETGYGYIKRDTALDFAGCFGVSSFVEKPDAATAQGYIDSGRYLWNSGMFMFRTSAVIASFAQHASDILDPLQQEKPYQSVPTRSFDVAIMENADRIAVIPCDPDWTDIGSWASLWEAREKDASGNALSGAVKIQDTQNCLIQTDGRLVVCAGLEDMIVVETSDALMVAKKSHVESIKQLVQDLKQSDAPEVLEATLEIRPWGQFKVLNRSSTYKVKEVLIEPGQMQSLQLHSHRTETWTVIEGDATVTLGKDTHILITGQTIAAAPKQLHRIANTGKARLRLIEVQHGAYLGEDDIVRLDDHYGRPISTHSEPSLRETA